MLVWEAQRCFALAKPRAGVASEFSDEKIRLVAHTIFVSHGILLYGRLSAAGSSTREASHMYTTIIRPILFALSKDDAEKAHELAVRAIQCLQHAPPLLYLIALWYRANHNPKPYQIWGMTFPNRVGLAAGLDKHGKMMLFMQALGFGFLTIGSVLPEFQAGRDRPRLFRLEEHQALINRMGFNSLGVDEVAENMAAVRSRMKVPVFASLGMMKERLLEEAHKDYCDVLAELWEFADGFTINVSSPNTPDLRKLQGREYIETLVKAVVAERNKHLKDSGGRAFKPVLVKLAPDLDEEQIMITLEGLAAGCADGVIMGNTTLTRPGCTHGTPHANEQGGFSGGKLFFKTMEKVKIIKRHAPKLPLVMAGAVSRPERARMAFDAGVDMVKVHTPLIYQGPSLITRLRNA